MHRPPIVVVGAGAAGLALACRLGEQGRDDVVLVAAPPGPLRPPERTWCTWQAGEPAWPEAVSARWHQIAVQGRTGPAASYALSPLTYTMTRSRDYERVLRERLSRTAVRHVEALVTGVSDGVGGAVVHGPELGADLVYDTRPVSPARPGHVTLLQHFRGWFVRTSEDAFDPAVAGLMDFRLAQPPGGACFGYVLPTSRREALVEHTTFSRTAMSTSQYDAALTDYCRDVLRLPPFEVLAAEQGVIPMTDAPFPRRLGRRVFRLGAAGGATRPSTGYTFTAAQRQAEVVATALREGGDPCPPAAYSRRHLWMDRLLLQALDIGRVDGADLFTGLFRQQPAERVLRFLDGTTTVAEDLAVMAAVPKLGMLRTALSPGQRARVGRTA